MWYVLIFFLGLAVSWETHYAFNAGRIYLRLENEDLVALNFSIDGLLNLGPIKAGQSVDVLAAPPVNSSLFVWNNVLWAMSGNQSASTDLDTCGQGTLLLHEYLDDTNQWVAAAGLEQAGLNDTSYYQALSYLTLPSSNLIYIYGGKCGADNSVSLRMLSLDMTLLLLSLILTATEPQAFYGAPAVWAPTPQQLFLVGGKSNSGWLSMYQLATWSFLAGWLSEYVLHNSLVESRTGALVLPIFLALEDTSVENFVSNYAPSAVLVAGGEGGDLWLRLEYKNNGWVWLDVANAPQVSPLLGAAVVFDTLVTIPALTGLRRRSDTEYTIELYSVDGFSSVAEVQAGNSTAGSKRNVGAIVAGAVVPIVLIVTAVAAWFWFRKYRSLKAKQPNELSEPLEYQLGHFRSTLDLAYSIIGSRPLDLYRNVLDTTLTVDVELMDLWVRKRQEYESRRDVGSFEGTGSDDETENDTESDESEKPGADGYEPAAKPTGGRMLARHSFLASTETLDDENSPVIGPMRSALALPTIRKVLRLDPGFIAMDTQSLDENVDVQVLVLSKRKSVLRVVNPDVESLRQRAPS